MNGKATNKILVIAQHEFITVVCRPAYLITTLGMPLLLLGTLWGEWLIAMRVVKNKSANTAAVVDYAGMVNFDHARRPSDKESLLTEDLENSVSRIVRLERYESLDQALDDLARERVFACHVIEGDYLKTGRITSYVRESRMGSTKSYLSERNLTTLIRTSLLEGRVTDEVRQRVLDPARIERLEVSPQGQIKPEMSQNQKLLSLMAPLLLCMLLTSSIFMSANYLLQSLILENQNRVMEVLLSSVRPIELLIGKTLGLGAAGIIPPGIYAFFPSLILVPYFATQGWRLMALAVIYVGLGYLLFAVLLAATGIIANGMRENSQLAGLWTFICLLPAIVFLLSGEMDSWAARAMSWFPLTAPTAMLIRICYTRVAAWDALLSIVSLVIGIWVALRYATKIFRASSLMYGKRPTLPVVWRWLRQA